MKLLTIAAVLSLVAFSSGCAGNGKAWVADTVEEDAADECEKEKNEDGEEEEKCKKPNLAEPAPIE